MAGGAIGWRRWTVAAVLLRVAVAFGWLGAMPMVSDARDYFDAGAGFAAGHAGGPFYWPPGEGLALGAAFAAFGSTVAVARWATIAASVAAVAIAALIARELAGDRAARAAGWIGAAYAPSVLLCGQTYSQHVAALCLAAVAYLGMRAARERRPWLFAATGLALGAGVLTRPSMLSVAPVVAAAWALAGARDRSARRGLWAGAALAACFAIACVAPACAHDARAGAGWTVSTNNERNLFLGNNPYTPDYKTSHLGQRSLDQIDPGARAYLESYYARADGRAAMRREAIEYVAHHPARTALRTVNRSTSFWGFDYLASREIQGWRGWGTPRACALLALEGGGYLVIASLALLTLFAMRGAGDGAWRAWLVALALAYEAPYALAFSGGTYHFPVVPLVVPLAAIAASRPAEAWARLRASRAAWAALAVFAAIQAQYAYYAVVMR